jgi:tetratricopeptide (TPR) repeat protein
MKQLSCSKASKSVMPSPIELNNKVAALLQNGQSDETIASLNLALLKLHDSSLSDTTCSTTTTSNTSIGKNTNPTSTWSCSSTCHHDPKNSAPAAVAQNLLLAENLYCYPALQYDEGMNTFTSPLFIDAECVDRTLVEATINFNLGFAMNTAGERQDTKAAIHQFLKTANSMPREYNNANHHSLAVYIAAFHNAGQLCLRALDYNQAIKVYSQASGILMEKLHLLNALDFEMCPERRCEIVRETLLFAAATLNCIAVCRISDKNEALPSNETLSLLAMALSIHERIDIDHLYLCRATATIMSNIGRVKFQTGDYTGSLAAYADALNSRHAVLGSCHLDVAIVHFKMAEAHIRLGMRREAIDMYEKYLAIASCLLGESHARVADVLMTIGQLYHDIGNVKRASDYLDRALQSSISAFGPYHQCVSFLYHELGHLALKYDDMDNAATFLEAGLNVERKLEGPNKEHRLSVSLVLLGDVTTLIGKTDEAIAYYLEALDMIHISKGPCEQAANILTNIASINEQEQEYDLAEKHLEEAVKILSVSSERCTLRASFNLNTLGLVQSKQGKYEMALESFLESLKIRTSIPEATNSQISNVCYNVASTYVKLGDFENSLYFYRECLALERKIEIKHRKQGSFSSIPAREEGHHQPSVYGFSPTLVLPRGMLLTMIEIASVYLQMGKFEKALHYYQDAMGLCSGYDDHSFVQREIGAIQRGICACYKGQTLRLAKESCKTNGIYNCAPAA